MNRRVLYFSLLGLAVTGCEGLNHKKALGDFEYANGKETEEIVIPGNLKKPKQPKEFFIKNDINHEGPIGENVDVRAPSLVLPVAASSRVDPTVEKSKIWFDQVLDDTDLQVFIYQALQEKLAIDGVSMDIVDAQKKIFESDWYHSESESGYWLFTEVESAESIKFRYSFESKPHGRSVALLVELVDYMRTDSQGSTEKIDLIEQQRLEMAMLNEVVAQVDYKYRLKQRENRLLRANKKFVTIGENSSGDAAYIVEIERSLLWSNLPLFFEKYGFEITDLDESKFIYFVDFVKPDNSFWDVIWGDDIPVVDVDEAKYKFVLAEDDKKTSVTIFDKDGKPASKETLERIFPVMEPGLSFRDAF